MLLEARGLNIYLETGAGPLSIVNNLDLDIPEGGVFGLAGESGCGKSLTALAIMGILPQNLRAEGEIRFKGRDLLKLPEAEFRALRGKELAMVFQEPMTSLNPVLRVDYQVREVITAHMGVSRNEADRMVLELLRQVRIPSPEKRMREYPHQMSGGMRQRVMMAMAIACGPALLIADEPTTALDVTIEAQILELLDTLRRERGMSVLLITHDLGIIAENAERVGIMYAGRLVELAGVRELFASPKHPYTMGLLRSLPKGRGEGLKPIGGAVPRPGELPPGCKFSNRCEYVIEGCRKEEPELRLLAEGHRARCIRSEEIPWP
ncbi:MAG: ABC transporter ATP-binding protein [Nitrospirota bacterium]